MVVHLAAYLVARLAFKAVRGDEETDKAKRAGTICTFMGNVGFMGIPVVKALFPNNPEMLIYVAIINVSFNVISWTLGVYTITGDKSNVSVRRAFLNPPTVALVAALPLFFFKAYIPAAVFTPIQSCANYLAGMTLPLSMIILGIRLAEIPFGSLFTSPVAYVSAALKLVVVPLVSFALLYPIHALFPANGQRRHNFDLYSDGYAVGGAYVVVCRNVRRRPRNGGKNVGDNHRAERDYDSASDASLCGFITEKNKKPRKSDRIITG